MPLVGKTLDAELVLPPPAPGEFLFSVTETAGVTRDGGTLSTMRFPVAVAVPFTEAPFGSGTCRVQDQVTGQFVLAGYRDADEPLTHSRCVGGARWGDYGNTGHRVKDILVDFHPTLLPNERRFFKLFTTGGSGDSPGGITITTPGSNDYYEVTVPGKLVMRVPRKGAMTLYSYFKNLVADQVLFDDVVSTEKGGLWMTGIAGAGPGGIVNNQATDFYSRYDTSGDGLDNGGDWTEESRPSKYFTSILFNNGEKACIKIDTIRCKTVAGIAFKGMNREVGTNGVPTPLDATWDVFLYFSRESEAVRIVYWFKSTGGDYDQASSSSTSLRADCAIEGMGRDIITTYTGSMQIATRDETAATKVARVTSATAGTIRQRAAPVANGSYGFTLSKTGPLAFTGIPVTMLEVFYDATLASGAAGVLSIPWNWRNKYPMGWSHTPANGRLRWEMLNPDQNDVDVGQSRTYHVILGHQWYMAEEHLVAHAGVYTDQQFTDAVKALGGVFEFKNAIGGSWVAGTQTGPGAQQPSLLGHCGTDLWDRARVWKRFPPETINRNDLLGAPNTILGLAGQLVGSVTKVDDALERQEQWIDTYHTEGTHPSQRNYRGYQSVVNGARTGPLGHRYYGGHPTSGSFENCGSNDYEYCSYPLQSWLRRNDRGDFNVAYECSLHNILIDQFHCFYDDGPGAIHGTMVDFNGHATTFHSSNRASGYEYQQNFEAPALLYLLTGEPWWLEALYHSLNSYNLKLYGYDASSTYFNAKSRGGPVSATVDVNDLIVSDVAGFAAKNIAAGASPVTAFPFQAYPLAGSGTLSRPASVTWVKGIAFPTTNDVLRCTAKLPGYAPFVDPWGAPQTAAFATNNERWVGAQIRSPRGAGGTTYKVLLIAPSITFGVPDGINAVFQYTATPIVNDDDLEVQVTTGAVNSLKTLGVHYTISNKGAGGCTVTFTAGNIPAAGTVVKMWFARFQVQVTPTPVSDFSGQDWEFLFHAGQGAGWGSINAIVGTRLQCSWTFGAPTHGSTVQVWSNPVGLSRLEGWQLAKLIGFAKCIGQFATNAQGTHDLYERIINSALHMRFTEQLESSAGAKTQMGGCGTFGARGGGNAAPGYYGGIYGSQNHTYFVYPAQPIMYAHEFGAKMAAAGFGAIFTSTFLTQMAELLVRLSKHGVMGVDGLQAIDDSNWNVLRRLPMGRGGKLFSPTSFQLFANPGFWMFCEESSRAARQGTDFFVSADDMNDLFAASAGPVSSSADEPTLLTPGGGSGMSFGHFLADVLAYCAEVHWHPLGQTAIRDAWLTKAMEIAASVLLFANENYSNMGTLTNPSPVSYPLIRGLFASNGAVAGGIRAKHWAGKHHAYWMRAARYPIIGWPS